MAGEYVLQTYSVDSFLTFILNERNTVVIIGIDPGLKGAIGVIDENNCYVIDIPTLQIEGKRTKKRATGKIVVKKKNMYDIWSFGNIISTISTTAISDGKKAMAFIEKSQAMPDQGGVSNFNYGFGFGVIQSVCTCYSVPFELVHPRTWKKYVMFGQGKEKDAAVYKAQQLFPTLTFKGPRGGLLDGRAEAILIAEYGRRFLLNGK